jgi:hypothetical protein
MSIRNIRNEFEYIISIPSRHVSTCINMSIFLSTGLYILSRVRGSVTNNLMVGFIGTSVTITKIMTAHNQWLSKTRSMSGFSSTVTNAERKIPSEWILLSVLTCPPFVTSEEPNRDHHLERLLLLLLLLLVGRYWVHRYLFKSLGIY